MLLPLQPLRLNDGTLMWAPRLLHKIEEGYTFIVAHRESLADGASLEVLLENPSGSGRTVHIVIIRCVGAGEGTIEIYRGVTVTTSGSSLTPVNLKIGCPITSVCSAEYGGTYDVSGAQRYVDDVLPGGTIVRAVGDAAEVGENVVLEPNNNIMVRLTNVSGTTKNFSIKIVWWEET